MLKDTAPATGYCPGDDPAAKHPATPKPAPKPVHHHHHIAVPVTESSWWNSGGRAQLGTVQHDLAVFDSDSVLRPGSDAVLNDVQVLGGDATTAAGNPPPVYGADYTGAMQELQAAGEAALAQQFNGLCLGAQGASCQPVSYAEVNADLPNGAAYLNTAAAEVHQSLGY